MTRTYAIVGAGIAGASVAYHLGRRTDDRVVVFERGEAASEMTAKSVAQFGFYGDATQYRMKRYGMALYNRFFADPRGNPRYESAGLLRVATTEEGAADLERAADRERVAGADDGDEGENGDGNVNGDALPGVRPDRDLVEYLPGDELKETVLAPPLDDALVEGALYRPGMGYMARPAELAREFLERAREAGVEFRFDTPVRAIETGADGSRVTAVVADEHLPVDGLVCAAGPWNVELARSVGIDLPVRHTLAPVLELDPDRSLPYSLPAISHYEGPHAIHRRRADALLVGYNPAEGYERDRVFDPDKVDETVPAGIRKGMLDSVKRLTPDFGGAPVADEWVGVRSQTPDGNPIVGPTGVEGFSIAAFHTSGIQLAPAVGRMVADQLLDGDPSELHDALSISRFDGYADRRD